ncbi:hypothetical protein [Pseudomonas savastanoi]|uniref:MalT-like TPR region domain-containing protein n=1 Tax=Pseudomonas savastanoi pv. savastanoi NCPPB 3335 TaxID=693985 RepID=A0ABC8BKL3_PSESS|nr:hypothetical protein [Pseudomonas savastanoi]ARD14372.1 hypothetical protein PSA3335_26985 [Pseudomonas savastanoi pv. savastanoi NCPPB 3335]
MGNVFLALGFRTQNAEHLLDAMEAYERALDHLSCELQPWDWALNKHNLGHALFGIADYEDGTESLEAAVEACQDALRVRTLDSGGSAWGKTKFLLGHTFLALGVRKTSIKDLERAIQEYQGALPKLSQQLRKIAERRIVFAQEIIERRGSQDA